MSEMTKPDAMTRATIKRGGMGKLKPTSTAAERKLRREANRKLIAAAKAKGGPEALKQVPPVALMAVVPADVDPNSDDALLESNITVQPVVNPLFAALIEANGGKRESDRVWIVPTGEKASQTGFDKIVNEILNPITTYSHEQGVKADKARKKGFRAQSMDYNAGYELARQITQTHVGQYTHINSYQWRGQHPEQGPHSIGAVVLSFAPGKMYVKVCTVPDTDSKEMQLYPGAPNLHLLRPTVVQDAKSYTADVAVALMEAAAARGVTVLDPTRKLSVIRRRLADAAVAIRVPGSPGLARLVVGCNRFDCDGLLGDPLMPASDEFACSTRSAVATAGEVARVPNLTAVHPHVIDVSRLATAVPYNDQVLRDYQNTMVGLHLATEIGLVNATAPGGGKTPMTLRGLRARVAKLVKRGEIASAADYQALLVIPANMRPQWTSEAMRFFPEAHVLVLESSNLAEQIERAQTDHADKPLILMGSYHAAMKLAEAIEAGTVTLDGFFDMAVDEAAILANSSSKQSKALMFLRSMSQVALGLTGTPIEKSEDDLGRLIAFVRNDPEMFHGLPLSKRFDLTTSEGVTEMHRHLGPVLYRIDKSEFENEVPTVQTDVVLFDPHSTEKALHDGARYHLKGFLTDLDAKVERLMELHPDDPRYEDAKAEVAAARGTALGGVTLSRLSASDPIGVKASKSVGKDLLHHAGLIDPAIRFGGTKRNQVAGMTHELVMHGEAVLVFTEFESVAQSMLADLLGRGVRAGIFKGGMSDKRRREAQEGFQGVPCAEHAADEKAGANPTCEHCQQPTLDVLVLTVEQGLNLQRASTMVHLDLKWVPSRLVQRIGRAVRFGSRNSHVTNIIVLMDDTIEIRVAGRIVPRAMKSLQALDLHRGIDIADTELGMAISGLADAVTDDEVEQEDEGYMALARDLLAAEDDGQEATMDWFAADAAVAA